MNTSSLAMMSRMEVSPQTWPELGRSPQFIISQSLSMKMDFFLPSSRCVSVISRVRCCSCIMASRNCEKSSPKVCRSLGDRPHR